MPAPAAAAPGTWAAPAPPDLARLGLEPADEILVRHRLQQPLGLILVGGPRGGGVSTTLQALRAAAPPDDAAACARRPGAHLPRTVLLDRITSARQIAAGVATIAHGRRVLGGLFLERAAHVFVQLNGWGMAPDRLALQLLFVMAQCRVRALCAGCRQPDQSAALRGVLARAANSWLTDAVRAFAARPGGCAACAGTGYRGWALAYEILDIDAGARVLVEDGVLGLGLEQALLADGRTLWDQGLRLLARGQCSLASLRMAVREPR